MYVLRHFECESCGKPTARKRHSVDPRICVDCGIRHAASASVQMANKVGPIYDRWLATQPGATVASGNH